MLPTQRPDQSIIRRDDYLVWIDLEMTGLDSARDVILEIATVITDNNLSIVAHGPHLVIHQPEEKLKAMDPWCTKTHTTSGLVKAVQESATSITQAERETLAFVKLFCKKNSARLCGNSIWQDRIFLAAYMPELLSYFHYRLIDISSIKELVRRWYPSNPATEFKKPDTHRASSDIIGSIEELNHYRNHFFINKDIV